MIRSTDPDIIRPYLEDASNLAGGFASEVVFPQDEKEVSEILAEASAKRIPVTVAGNGTGLTGARIPFGGMVLSMEKLEGVEEVADQKGDQAGFAVVKPGTTLRQLQETVSEKGLLYPPDPTEQNAFIGASVSTNGSGARSFKYGATRRWVRRLRVVLADGSVADLSRGKGTAPILFKSMGAVPFKYRTPPIKCAAGYYLADDMDPIDLFIGAEGTLGVITRVEVGLIPKPDQLFSGVVFFIQEEDAWGWADQARRQFPNTRALEYFDWNSLGLLREKDPRVPEDAAAALFFEEEVTESLETAMGRWLKLCQQHRALVDQSWFSTTPGEQQEFRQFRYSLPVQVNELLRQFHQTKIGTDFAVPNGHYFDMLKGYQEALSKTKLIYCLFGHIGENHLHLNLIPRDEQQAREGWELYHQLARKVIGWGGTISAEHGIGKIRRDYLAEMIGRSGLEEMALIKRRLDPAGILGRGNIFPGGI